VTTGDDLAAVLSFLAGRNSYPATDVVAGLMKAVEAARIPSIAGEAVPETADATVAAS